MRTFFISLPSFLLMNIYQFSNVCPGLMTKIDRYTVCITENIETKLRSQDYLQLQAPFQQEITKVVVDSNTPRAGEPETEIEPATEIFCHIYDQPLSRTLHFLSFSKQSLLYIEKYERRERDIGDCRPPRVPRVILFSEVRKGRNKGK